MSTVKYYPNWPNTVPEYDIGTEGRELFSIAEGSSVFGTLLNAARSLYKGRKGDGSI